jgi:ATP-dependent helicase/nuclease subunit B
MAVSTLQYIGLKGSDKIRDAPVSGDTWPELIQLLRHYFKTGAGYGARLRMQKDRFGSDYDHLSRLGEWEETDPIDAKDVP